MKYPWLTQIVPRTPHIFQCSCVFMFMCLCVFNGFFTLCVFFTSNGLAIPRSCVLRGVSIVARRLLLFLVLSSFTSTATVFL